MSGFSSVAFPFGGTRTVQANAQLGIFSAANYSTTYGTGGDDTAAVQAALNAAIAVGGVAFLPPPSSGFVNVSATLNLGNNGTSLIGASPGVSVRVVPGSNLDWVVSTGLKASVDYRTVFAVNYRAQTFNSIVYSTYNPALPVKLSNGGSIANVAFVADTGTVTALGHGVMLNAAFGFEFRSVSFSGFTGEDISLWDCYGTKIVACDGKGTGRHVGIHRACYDTQVVVANAVVTTLAPYIVYTEQFQILSGPLLTLSPEYTKFVDAHSYSSTLLASAFDLQGAVFVNLTGCTADNVTNTISTATRFGAATYTVLSDVGAIAGVNTVAVTSPVVNTGTPTSPNIGLIPSGTAGNVLTSVGGVWASAAPTGGSTTVTAPITNSGTTQNPVIGLSTPLAVASGGTGSASPSGVIAGTNITVTGTFPNQTVNAQASGATLNAAQLAIATLTHLWRCNDAAGSLTLADSKGSIALTFGGASRAGAPGMMSDNATCFLTDGTAAGALLGAGVIAPATYSLEALIVAPGSPSATASMTAVVGNAPTSSHYTYVSPAGFLYTAFNNGGDVNSQFNAGFHPVLLQMTYDGSTLNFYFNGMLVASRTSVTAVATGNIKFGVFGDGTSYPAQLRLSNIATYSTVLTQAQRDANLSAVGIRV